MVNFNGSGGSPGGHTDQHGLHLRNYDLGEEGEGEQDYHNWGVSLGVHGPPGNHNETRCDLAQIQWDHDLDAPDGANDRSGDTKEHTITHELGHGVSIAHHQPTPYDGDTDCAMRYVFDNWNLWKKSAGNDPDEWSAMPIGIDFCDADDDCKGQIDVSD